MINKIKILLLSIYTFGLILLTAYSIHLGGN